MNKRAILLASAACVICGTAAAAEGNVPYSSFGHLDHVLVIMMENHSAAEVLGNAATPYISGELTRDSNLAGNYWAVGHPSLTNYLEIVGGSNFGILDDNWPVWPNGGCVDNNPSGSGCGGAYAPLQGAGMDYGFPATVDACLAPWFNQLGPLPQCKTVGTGSAIVTNNWGIVDYPSASYTAKTIAHQLVESGRGWKSYQESLPTTGSRVDGVNYSDGTFSNLSPVGAWVIGGSNVSVQKLYAVKHNPFAYFHDIETGTPDSGLSLAQVVDFTGPDGLYADLARGSVPALAFVAPNQCHDMHGAGGGTAQCGDDSHALQMGDAALEQIVGAIKASPLWSEGRSAIVVVWDENDYGNAPNQVALFVQTNYGKHGHVSSHTYNHYSLTKTIEAALGLPCLNHACDSSTKVMSDLFGSEDD